MNFTKLQSELNKKNMNTNLKTGLIVAAAASGALISAPALLTTSVSTLVFLYIAKK
jgi:energy-converting hydrogenase Eha subunit C